MSCALFFESKFVVREPYFLQGSINKLSKQFISFNKKVRSQLDLDLIDLHAACENILPSLGVLYSFARKVFPLEVFNKQRQERPVIFLQIFVFHKVSGEKFEVSIN